MRSSRDIGIVDSDGNLNTIIENGGSYGLTVTDKYIYCYENKGWIYDIEKDKYSIINDCFFINDNGSELYALTFANKKKNVNYSKIVFK